jgi:hypothetical protein
MNSIKDMVKDNKKATFSFYRDQTLWYKTDCGFEFPIPLNDVGSATYMLEMKAITCMRYIRKWIKELEECE